MRYRAKKRTTDCTRFACERHMDEPPEMWEQCIAPLVEPASEELAVGWRHANRLGRFAALFCVLAALLMGADESGRGSWGAAGRQRHAGDGGGRQSRGKVYDQRGGLS